MDSAHRGTDFGITFAGSASSGVHDTLALGYSRSADDRTSALFVGALGDRQSWTSCSVRLGRAAPVPVSPGKEI
ncbi:MAG: hypothetical protein WAO09_02060 [Candidatus Dormiibacterota bacterium]|jgi:hypothetical protein